MATFYIIFLLSLGVLSSALGAFVVLRHPGRPVQQAFFVMCAGLGVWCAGFGLLMLRAQFGVFDQLTLFGGLLATVGFAVFAHLFPDKTKIPYVLEMYLIVPLVVGVLIWFNTFMSGGIVEGYSIYPVNTSLYPLYGITLLSLVVIGVVRLVQTYRRMRGMARMKIRYVLLGLLLFFGIAVLVNVILPAFDLPQFNMVGFSSVLIFLGMTAYALVRHQVMDIRIIIQRGLAYSFVVSVLVIVYVGLISLSQYVLGVTNQISPLVSGGITALVGGFSASWLIAKFKHLTDSFFFKGGYNYKEALHTLTHVLYTTHRYDDLIYAIESTLQDIMRADVIRLYLNGKPVYPRESDIVMPLRGVHGQLGVLVLGSKKSGDPYTDQDLQLIKTFSYSASLALEKATLYTKVEEHAEFLEKRVRERTFELEKSQEIRSLMLTDLAHNLQTPLSIVKNQIHHLSQKIEQLQPLERSIDRLSQFVYRLLRLTQLDQKVEENTGKVFSLSAMIQASAEYFAVVGSTQNVIIDTDVAPGVSVYGSSEEIEECLANIVSNAIKYRRTHVQSRITVTLIKEHNHALIQIADNGQGIAEKDLPFIFDRMYRVKENASIQGTGLGLAFCKRIVERHKGCLEVISSPGVGSTFIIKLPICCDAPAVNQSS